MKHTTRPFFGSSREAELDADYFQVMWLAGGQSSPRSSNNMEDIMGTKFILEINNHGDMIGVDIFGGAFLLERIEASEMH